MIECLVQWFHPDNGRITEADIQPLLDEIEEERKLAEDKRYVVSQLTLRCMLNDLHNIMMGAVEEEVPEDDDSIISISLAGHEAKDKIVDSVINSILTKPLD